MLCNQGWVRPQHSERRFSHRNDQMSFNNLEKNLDRLWVFCPQGMEFGFLS